MNIEFKKYAPIKYFVNIDVKIILNDDLNNPLYEGNVDKAPKEVRERYYYKVLMECRTAIIFVYDDDIANKIIEENNKKKGVEIL